MKKQQYDAVLKALSFAQSARENVEGVQNKVYSTLDSVFSTVGDVLEGFETKAKDMLEESPLEDPVVSSSSSPWGASTDGVGNLSRTEKEDFILASGRKVGNPQFSNEEYVRGLSDGQLDSTYKALVFAEKLAKVITDKFKGN